MAFSENSFTNFGSSVFGTREDRYRISDSLKHLLNNEEPVSVNKDWIYSELKKFTDSKTKTREENELFNYALKHKKLKNQMHGEILGFINDCADEFSVNNNSIPFFEENCFLNELSEMDCDEFLNNLENIQLKLKNTKTGNVNNANFEFYKNELKEIESQLDKDKKARENQNKEKKQSKDLLNDEQKEDLLRKKIAIFRNLQKDLRTSFDERYLAWKIQQMDLKRQKYLKDLYERIRKFQQVETILNPFLQGLAYGKSDGLFDDYGFELISEYSELLARDKSLKELADLIGRHDAASKEYKKELREKVVLKTEYHMENAYKGQISGLQLSGEIGSALPAELGLYKNDITKAYFIKKFAEKKLLSYMYENQVAKTISSKETEEVQVEVKDKKGPVIICVDTSGSMSGTPENVAKTITFALAKKTFEEDRKCFLISFSTGIEICDLSFVNSFSGKDINPLTELIQFLKKSFMGGTDATPALDKSLELLQEENWKNADVLMISDFVMDTLPDDLVEKIEEQRKKKSKFYSLVIGQSGNNETIKSFDENWYYDTNLKNPMRRLVRDIKKIGEEKVDG